MNMTPQKGRCDHEPIWYNDYVVGIGVIIMYFIACAIAWWAYGGIP